MYTYSLLIDPDPVPYTQLSMPIYAMRHFACLITHLIGGYLAISPVDNLVDKILIHRVIHRLINSIITLYLYYIIFC